MNAMHQGESDQIKSHSDRIEDGVFFDKIADEAIERAAQMWGAGAFTMGNCTGLGSCPA
jgi:hypothetical protein